MWLDATEVLIKFLKGSFCLFVLLRETKNPLSTKRPCTYDQQHNFITQIDKVPKKCKVGTGCSNIYHYNNYHPGHAGNLKQKRTKTRSFEMFLWTFKKNRGSNKWSGHGGLYPVESSQCSGCCSKASKKNKKKTRRRARRRTSRGRETSNGTRNRTVSRLASYTIILLFSVYHP